MIKIDIYKANINVNAGKNGTFLEGELYVGRISKDGGCYVLRSEEGYWIPLVYYRRALSLNTRFDSAFKDIKKSFYVENYKELKIK